MNDRDEADLLVFQEPATYRPMLQPAIRDEIDFTLQELSNSSTATQEDVMDALRHYGYKAMLAGTTERRLRDEDLKGLSQMFADSRSPAG
jgi:hypothetical protein